MHPFLVLSGASEATLRHRGNIHKLYRLYIFLREGHHFVLYVLNGPIYLFPAAAAAKPCLRDVWLYYGMHPLADRPQRGQFQGALFYSRANHTHSV